MYACMEPGSPGSMSLENMIRNTLLGNEGSTPRAKGMQAVSVSKICEGHSQILLTDTACTPFALGVLPSLPCEQNQPKLAERELEQRNKTRADLRGKLFRRTLLEGAKNVLAQGTCLPRDPAFTNKDFERETGQEVKGLAPSNTYY